MAAHTYIAIDHKTFYACIECVGLGDLFEVDCDGFGSKEGDMEP